MMLNMRICAVALLMVLMPFALHAEAQKPKAKPKIIKITDDAEHQNQDKQNVQPPDKINLSDEAKAMQKTVKVVDDGNGGMAIEIVAEPQPAVTAPTATSEILNHAKKPKPVAIDSMPLPAPQDNEPLISPINQPAKQAMDAKQPAPEKTGKTFVIDATKPADKIILTPEPAPEVLAPASVRKIKTEPKKNTPTTTTTGAVKEVKTVIEATPERESPSLNPKVTQAAIPAKIEPVTARPLAAPEPSKESVKAVVPNSENMQRKANIVTNPHIARSILTSGIRELEPIDSIVLLNKGKNGKLYYFTELNNLHDQKITHRWIQGEKILAEKTLYVNGNYWRAWSSVVVNGNDNLRIEVLDSNGKVMSSQEIKVN